MYGNHYFNQYPRFQPVEPMNQQPSNQQYVPPIAPIQPINNNLGLLGKSVDSVEVVKAMDIPLDGSTSYFPLTDGSAIVTKKLLSDGTSKTIVYKPVEEPKSESPKYITLDELEKMDFVSGNDLKDIRNEIRDIRNALKERKK